jgi:hypothetical protein
VGSWMLPVTATSFAAGLLLWPELPIRIDPGVLLGIGLLAIAGAWLLSGGMDARPGALARARLLPSDPDVVRAVAARRVGPGAPVATTVLAVAGVLLLGLGWSGMHDRGLDTSLLARLAPQRVTIEGVLQTDPSAATFGWSAVAQVHRVEWSEGAA